MLYPNGTTYSINILNEYENVQLWNCRIKEHEAVPGWNCTAKECWIASRWKNTLEENIRLYPDRTAREYEYEVPSY